MTADSEAGANTSGGNADNPSGIDLTGQPIDPLDPVQLRSLWTHRLHGIPVAAAPINGYAVELTS